MKRKTCKNIKTNHGVNGMKLYLNNFAGLFWQNILDKGSEG